MNKIVKWIVLPGIVALAMAVAKTEIEERLLQAEAERRYVALGLPHR